MRFYVVLVALAALWFYHLKQVHVDISTILWSMSLALVGLALCNPRSEMEKVADTPMGVYLWCHYPLIRVLYGWGQCVGLAFVYSTTIFTIFCIHWWYVFFYVGGVLAAKLISFIINIPIACMCVRRLQLYGALRMRRLIGTLLIAVGIILCII